MADRKNQKKKARAAEPKKPARAKSAKTTVQAAPRTHGEESVRPGIVGYAAYLPSYSMPRDILAAEWQGRSPGGSKRVARFDEDSLTMAATATQDCIASLTNRKIAGLYFASTTAPFLERLNSSLIAAVCDIEAGAFTLDLSASLRAATSGLKLELDRMSPFDGGPSIICAADTREAAPGSAEEHAYADAAAAVAVGREGVIAEYIAGATFYDDFFEEVRRDRDSRVISFSSKFSTERGYRQAVGRVVRDVLAEANMTSKDVAKLILPSPDSRSHLQLAKKLGFEESQVQDIAWEDVGATGCAMPLVLLTAALETARPGDVLLATGYGNGAEALLFRATRRIHDYRPRVSLEQQRKQSIPYATYALYRKAREYPRTQPEVLEISNVFYAREESQIIRLQGNECGHCGTRQFPKAKYCISCQKGDRLKDVALARTGKVFTFVADNLNPSPFPPTLMAVVDLDGGGRFYCELVDVPPEEVTIGMPVELVIRRLTEGGGLHHYYWKGRPRRW